MDHAPPHTPRSTRLRRLAYSTKAGAWIAATAYASATDGEVFDEADGKLYTPVEALKLCHDLKREIPQLELQMKEVRKRPREAPNPSPAIVSARIVDADDESG